MNAFTLLKTDHKKVAGILEKIDATTERAVKTREELFTQLKTDLDIHAERLKNQFSIPSSRSTKNRERSPWKPGKSIGSLRNS
jgi:hypothetical protein